MTAPLIVVTGTGTGIGKTHVSRALVLAWIAVLERQGVASPQVAGLKPVESGVDAHGVGEDGAALERLSTFHAEPRTAPYRLTRPVSPHLAARELGIVIEPSVVRAQVDGVRRRDPHGVLVELAGGLFSPLGPRLSNADVALTLDATLVLLVAPDRLGVLHDVAAASRAANGCGLTLSGVVLVAPDAPDASTGTNVAELPVVTDLPVLANLPRGTVEELARRTDVRALVERLTPPARRSP